MSEHAIARPLDQVQQNGGEKFQQPLVDMSRQDVAQLPQGQDTSRIPADVPKAAVDFKQDTQRVASDLGNNGTAVDLSDSLKRVSQDAGKKFDPQFVDQLNQQFKKDGTPDLSVTQVSPKVLEFKQEGNPVSLRGDVNGLLRPRQNGQDIDTHPQNVLDEFKSRRAQKAMQN